MRIVMPNDHKNDGNAFNEKNDVYTCCFFVQCFFSERERRLGTLSYTSSIRAPLVFTAPDYRNLGFRASTAARGGSRTPEHDMFFYHMPGTKRYLTAAA